MIRNIEKIVAASPAIIVASSFTFLVGYAAINSSSGIARCGHNQEKVQYKMTETPGFRIASIAGYQPMWDYEKDGTVDKATSLPLSRFGLPSMSNNIKNNTNLRQKYQVIYSCVLKATDK